MMVGREVIGVVLRPLCSSFEPGWWGIVSLRPQSAKSRVNTMTGSVGSRTNRAGADGSAIRFL